MVDLHDDDFSLIAIYTYYNTYNGIHLAPYRIWYTSNFQFIFNVVWLLLMLLYYCYWNNDDVNVH